jgi:hypothetical protein
MIFDVPPPPLNNVATSYFHNSRSWDNESSKLENCLFVCLFVCLLSSQRDMIYKINIVKGGRGDKGGGGVVASVLAFVLWFTYSLGSNLGGIIKKILKNSKFPIYFARDCLNFEFSKIKGRVDKNEFWSEKIH